jgi:hypothetical protein
VNVIIGQRGSGKTHTIMREMVKLLAYPHSNYTSFIYSSNKLIDDQTMAKFKPFFDGTFLKISFLNHDDLPSKIDEISELKQAFIKLQSHLIEPTPAQIDDDAYVDYERDDDLIQEAPKLRKSPDVEQPPHDISDALKDEYQQLLSKFNEYAQTGFFREEDLLSTGSVRTNPSARLREEVFKKYVAERGKTPPVSKHRMPNSLKGRIIEKEYYELLDALNITNINGPIPHILIFIDDCIDLLIKRGALFKKLFENRQPRITYFLGLQDVQGIPPSMKSNMDSLTLFGGFPKQKFNSLFYQIPTDADREELWISYKSLTKTEQLFISFDLDGTKIMFIRKSI